MESGREDYRIIKLSASQRLLSMLVGMGAGILIIQLFFRQWTLAVAAALIGAFVGPWVYKDQLKEKRQTDLRKEFSEALYDLMVSLRAGRSLEGAVLSLGEETEPDSMPLLGKEWKQMAGAMNLGIPVEQSLKDLGERSGVEEILSFARSVEICKRSEGNITAVMENTIHMIQDRMELRAELKVLLARKKMESRVMTVMPFVIIAMLLIMSPDYLAPLYTSVRGYLIMAVCSILSILSILISRKMVQIDL